MALHKVWLIGSVAIASRTLVDEWGAGRAFVVATRRDDFPEVIIDHHQVRDTHSAQVLALGTDVLVEDQVVLVRESDRHIVLARSVMALSTPPEPDHESPGMNTHRSPMSHLRSGHWRRLKLGQPDQRLVWVRESRVRGTPASLTGDIQGTWMEPPPASLARPSSR
jgi:hypothetical protein